MQQHAGWTGKAEISSFTAPWLGTGRGMCPRKLEQKDRLQKRTPTKRGQLRQTQVTTHKFPHPHCRTRSAPISAPVSCKTFLQGMETPKALESIWVQRVHRKSITHGLPREGRGASVASGTNTRDTRTAQTVRTQAASDTGSEQAALVRILTLRMSKPLNHTGAP